MSFARVLFDIIPDKGDIIDVPVQQAHHIRDVRRVQHGDKIEVIDRKGNCALAEIVYISKEKVSLEIQSRKEHKNIMYNAIHLYCAIIPEKRFDYILQKCTEIGVVSCTPVTTRRTVAKYKPEKLTRWQKICDDAARQCGGIPMTMNQPENIADITEMQHATRIIADTRGKDIALFERTQETIQLLIGPEGGFTDEEYMHACEKGWLPHTFHTNILRVETAAVVCSTLLQRA
jgi:16S rRNA (uracil1498-N3)-methyltransferase